MNTERKQTEKLALLYEKYALKDTVPCNDRTYILRSRERMFRKILKSVKRYSFFSALASAAYFFSKKHSVLLLAVKKILFITAVISVAGGSYYYFAVRLNKADEILKQQSVLSTPQNNAVQVEAPAVETVNTKDIINKKTEKPVNLDNTRYIIRIKRFTSTSGTVGSDEMSKFLASMEKTLSSGNGKNFAVLSDVITFENAAYMVTGSIDRFNDEYVMNIKMIDMQSSQIKLIIEKKAESVEKFSAFLPEISKKVRAAVE